MLITGWLAKKDGCEGLAFPDEFSSGNVRIYGNVYGHPKFRNGEFVRTGIVASYSDGKITTASGEEYFLKREADPYHDYLQAQKYGRIIVKNWKVKDGKIVGKALDSSIVEGKVIAQSIKPNVCELEDGRLLFVDWLSKDPEYNPELGGNNLLLFCVDECMPDIFGNHRKLFVRD